MYVAALIFRICFTGVLYTYILYPLLLRILAYFKNPRSAVFEKNDELPAVSILIAAHNEEAVIGEKIRSVLESAYPLGKIQLLVGSDNSSDGTDEIVQSFAAQSPVELIRFNERTGKVSIINTLVTKAKHELLILTDANVLFDRDTIYHLVKHFKDDAVALVDSRMINTGIKDTGISLQEKSYIQTEAYIKYYEGLLWGSMMGPFGGCYSIRKFYYREVPSHFLVDDFYINMQALLLKGKCINDLDAKAYEEVSNNAGIEFGRKVRIAAGSFQNMFHFLSVLFRFDSISFCFFSHKVLRWTGPFLILGFYLCSILLWRNPLYFTVMLITTLVLLAPFFDFLLRKSSVNIAWLRFLSHFTTTNAAQVAGLVRYLTGITSGIWQPTARKQD